MNFPVKAPTINKWSVYKAMALRTESVPDNTFAKLGSLQSRFHAEATRLLHAALGLCTEIEEFKVGTTKVNFIEEIGDVFWYLAIADDVFPWTASFSGYHNMETPAYTVSYYVGEFQDAVKRHLFYGAEVNRGRIVDACHAIAWHLEDELEKAGFELGQAWAANIIKLEKRYPDKFFDAKAAIHRDVDRELEHISETGEVMIIGATPAMVTVDELEHTPMVGEIEVKPYTLELGEPLDKETIMESFFPLNQVQLSFQGFNDLVRSLLTLGQIEKMAMDLAFARAEQYRKMGALELARGYDAMYRSYSGKGDRLDDFSLAIMWQEAGYSMDEGKVKELLERWK